MIEAVKKHAWTAGGNREGRVSTFHHTAPTGIRGHIAADPGGSRWLWFVGGARGVADDRRGAELKAQAIQYPIATTLEDDGLWNMETGFTAEGLVIRARHTSTASAYVFHGRPYTATLWVVAPHGAGIAGAIDSGVCADREEAMSQAAAVINAWEHREKERACRGAALIDAERQRQIQMWGDDSQNGSQELVLGAIAYAGSVLPGKVTVDGADPWPWEPGLDHRPSADASAYDRARVLVKAGALIAAELDRLLQDDPDLLTQPTRTPRDVFKMLTRKEEG